MKIYTEAPEGATVIQNYFIDQYMPEANGEFVKVYLYLLRCANTGRELSLSSIADVFEHTENDVRRALSYWENQGLLRIELGKLGELLTVTFTEPWRSPAQEEVPADSAREPLAGEEDGKELSPEEQKELRQLFFVAEQYLQRPLTSQEQHDYVYYYSVLHLSFDLIEYLLEYCISKGTTSPHYMRSVALAWAEKGIRSVREAKKETTLYNKNYYEILNAFGIKGRSPAPPEQEMMDRWLNEYGFSIDIVLEACRRTICQTHQPNFQYADKILGSWYKQGVGSMRDIEALDQKRAQDKSAQKKSQSRQRSSANRFNNFSQREYDYGELEKKLLGQ